MAVLSGHYELFALGTATTTALSGLLTAEAFASASVMTVTRWNVTATFLLHAIVATLLGGWASLAPSSIYLLMLSGALAITIAAPAYYGAISMLGARAGVLVFSLNAPLTFVIGALILGEWPSLWALTGLVLVLAGIAVATWSRGGDEGRIAHSRLGLGIGLGLIAALGQAGGAIAARPAMEAGCDPFAAMAVRFGFAAVPLLLMQSSRFARQFDGKAPTRAAFGFTLAGCVVGNGIGMPLLLVALAHAPAGNVATLAATSPIVILPMIWLRRGQAPNLAAWLGAAATFAGSALVLAR